MSNQADIRDVQVLSDLRTAFGKFGGDLQQILPALQMEFEEIDLRFEERQRHWECQVSEAEEAAHAARRELSDCQDQGGSDDEDGGDAPDCGYAEEQVGDAEKLLAECEENLETVKQWRHRIEVLIADFQNDIHKLSNLASVQTGSAQKFLTDKIAILDRYVGGASTPSDGLQVQEKIDRIPADKEFTPAEKEALYKYSDDEYLRINAQLREGCPDDITLQRAQLISKALLKLPAYQGAVYRGSAFGPYADNYIPGKIVEEPAFTSGSRSAMATLPGKVFFTITSKTGRAISKYAKYPEEDEILFDRGTKFKVLSRNEVKYETGDRTEIQIEEI